MQRLKLFGCWGILIIGFVGLVAGQEHQPKQQPKSDQKSAETKSSNQKSVRFMILIPADAVLEIEGEKMEGQGDLRQFETPPLAVDQDVVYTLKASWKEERKQRATERKVTVRGGQQVEVDLYDDRLSPDEKAVVELTNKERERAGLAPLVVNMKLMRAARAHSANMARQNVLTHELDGKSPMHRIRDAHYRHGEYGENCAGGSRTPVDAVRGWLNSEGHRENMMNPGFKEIGIGMAVGKQGRKFWTQVFAEPAGSYSRPRGQ